MAHPCLLCGACCAHFRVAFHWSETDPFLGGAVPAELTSRLDPHRVAMRGTQAGPVRCIALQGQPGVQASCGIYAQRPSVCRAVVPAWEFGQPSAQCDKARAAHGLALLTPQDWLDPGGAGVPSLPRSA
ncbi:YkgJ family cysteine cluster protein [Dyella sp.]|jgi:Fe-S-cluster containining protein|uniref:YkgJ family cysteine cluster protein n=1 Tax=Dyella sp. TaxID=1869338 RepID=UPI002D7A06B8|nr:YkgJ family cysteine cluster protein [Dyella sp.]HET6433691.1 YkgJ family cysteine cluster protein [Dyella sp.]